MRLNAKNNAETKLVEPVSESDTSIVVEDASVLPEVPYRLSIGDEIVEVTGVDGNTLTVDRAAEGTEAFSHDAGSVARNRFTAGMYDGIFEAMPSDGGSDSIETASLDMENFSGQVTLFKLGRIVIVIGNALTRNEEDLGDGILGVVPEKYKPYIGDDPSSRVGSTVVIGNSSSYKMGNIRVDISGEMSLVIFDKDGLGNFKPFSFNLVYLSAK